MKLAIRLLLFSLPFLGLGSSLVPRSEFWLEPRRGVNFFNRIPAESRFQAAAELGVDFIRLAPDKWDSEKRDFLIGDAGQFQNLVATDLKRLKQVLDWAADSNHQIILTMLSLPGARWRQHNDHQDDYRLWNSRDHRGQTLEFWRQLAREVGDHPALLAYDPLNEPHPERQAGIGDPLSSEFREWLETHRGSLADLDRFYDEIIAAIRSVDPETTIVVEGYAHGSAAGLAQLRPRSPKDRIVYSFHFYEPWTYTTHRVNQGRFDYPGRMPSAGGSESWRRKNLERRIEPVLSWAKAHGISSEEIMVAEFGCDRRVPGAGRYLEDLISLFKEAGFHWAFYSYREDVWNGMDYELGTGEVRLGADYWDALERGEYRPKPWRRNELFSVLAREFER